MTRAVASVVTPETPYPVGIQQGDIKGFSSSQGCKAARRGGGGALLGQQALTFGLQEVFHFAHLSSLDVDHLLGQFD